MGARPEPKWEPRPLYDTSDPEFLARFDSYALKVRRGTLWLLVTRDPRDRNRYQYVSSMGANSDESFSGCLEPEDNGLTLEQAQAKVFAKVQRMNGRITYIPFPRSYGH